MNILHTSDWHLGKYLDNRDRLPEQREAIAEICRIADEREVHLVLISGDIFDTAVPSAAAEELFYDAVERLAGGGKRGIVVIAGNHDNPERLCAAKSLADRNGIVLLGMPGDEASQLANSGLDVKVVQSGAGWLELQIDGVPEHAVIIALPYPSEARLAELLTFNLNETELGEAYAERVGKLFSELAGHFREDTVNLVMSHLFILGGEPSDSERPIQLGGAPVVGPDKLPPQAQYIALGHLHKPQKVGGTKSAYYSGSLLPYSFSESGSRKAVFIVEVFPGMEAVVQRIELQSGKSLIRQVALHGLEEAIDWLNGGAATDAWIDLEIHVDQPLTQEQIRTLRELSDNIVNIWPVLKNSEQSVVFEENRRSKPLKELFEDFYKAKTGVAPREDLTRFFLEIAATDEAEDEKPPLAP
jgi:exonuclease SbcD